MGGNIGGEGHWALTVTGVHSSDPDPEPCQDRSFGAVQTQLRLQPCHLLTAWLCTVAEAA